MKRFLAILYAAIEAVSCTIMPEPVPVNVLFVGKAPLNVKGNVWDDDSSIRRLDLLVFRDRDGMLLHRSSCTGNLPLEATVPSGQACRWYVMANAPEGALDCTTMDRFLQKQFSILDGPVMHSEGVETFQANGTTVQAELSRFACKVGLGSISINWPEALPCTLDTIALTNVLETTSPGTNTHNAYNIGVVSEDLSGMFAKYPGYEIRTSAPQEIDATLFCMPSPATRLALCITAHGQPNWYPIDLPPLQENQYYMVDNVVIKGPGAPGVDMPVERTFAEFVVNVRPWEENPVTAKLL